ncbi:MAG: proline--tRNA ligase [Zetaproteobacteria bacterium]|nr:MAG: proline--tRNA ligase [Zetaproteobacteria bacterium]
MRYSRFFAPTLRDDPADADVVSHRLLLRAGYIRRVTSGVYDFLPLGLRVLRKIEAIVREEMERAGALELLMPMVQPAELWQQSGRWEKYGPELLRFRDRHNHPSCLGPTHEEVICDLVGRELRSYKQLPMTLYQIQAKFRDEIRPRFGLMRGREFVMKDAYSFHADDDCLRREYRNMFAAYERIFTRLGLRFRAVEADTGSIGGRDSHEFHVLADSGEDLIAHCASCDYAANVEKAQAARVKAHGEDAPCAEVATPGLSSVEDVAAFLDVSPALLLKTLVYRVRFEDGRTEIVAACLRGDDQLQPVKLQQALDALEVVPAGEDEIASVGGVAGFVGPIGLRCRVLVDASLADAYGLVAGANKVNTHLTGVNVARDVVDKTVVDLREAREGDRCVRCGGELSFSRGIEVGHVFALGTCYTEPMDVRFQAQDGSRKVATMGCYGIGISRLVAAIVEQCHDQAGIAWPVQVAPFQVALISMGRGEQVERVAEQLYAQLGATGIEVLWDDRAERPGVKFKDAELIGIPIQLVVGARTVADGEVELGRRGEPRRRCPIASAVAEVEALLEAGAAPA